MLTDKPEEPTKTRTKRPDTCKKKYPERNSTEYFDMELLSLVYTKPCVGEQFENISEYNFYTCMNLLPRRHQAPNQNREKNTYLLSDIPDERTTAQTGQGELEEEYPENTGY